MQEALVIRDMSVHFGGLTALDGASLSLASGCLTGLIGPNGAGKTTLIDAACGFVSAKGEVRFGETDISSFGPHKRSRLGLARTFQGVELFDELTARENLLVSAERTRWWSPLRDLVFPTVTAATNERVDRVLDLLELGFYANQLPDQLSLGHQKIVGFGRALATEPTVVLLDEPAAGLSSHESVELGRKLRRALGDQMAMLLVDHDMGLVLDVCDYVYVLDFGRVIAEGTPEEIANNEIVIRAYLGDAGQQQSSASANGQ